MGDTHEDSDQESKGEGRCMFSDTLWCHMCDVCLSPDSSPALPGQLGVCEFSSILTCNCPKFASDPTGSRAQLPKTTPNLEGSCKWSVQAVQLLPGWLQIQVPHTPLLRFGSSLGTEAAASPTEMRMSFLFQDSLGYWEMLKNCPLTTTSLTFTPLPLGSGTSHTWIGYEQLHLRTLVLLEWLHGERRKMERFSYGFGSWMEWLFQSQGPQSFRLPVFLVPKLVRTMEQIPIEALVAWVGI